MNHFDIIEEFGVSEEEFESISSYFLCSLNYKDWESIQFFEESELEDPEEDEDSLLKLPTGRWAEFNADLLRKEMLAQMD